MHSKPREREVEKHFCAVVHQYGGLAYKWSSPSMRGVPDRIVIMPGGRVLFVEIKRPGGRLSRLQEQIGRRLKKIGAYWAVLSSIEEVDEFFMKKEWLQHE